MAKIQSITWIHVTLLIGVTVHQSQYFPSRSTPGVEKATSRAGGQRKICNKLLGHHDLGTLQEVWEQRFGAPNHRIMESLSLERPLRSPSPTLNPSPPCPLSHIASCSATPILFLKTSQDCDPTTSLGSPFLLPYGKWKNRNQWRTWQKRISSMRLMMRRREAWQGERQSAAGTLKSNQRKRNQ